MLKRWCLWRCIYSSKYVVFDKTTGGEASSSLMLVRVHFGCVLLPRFHVLVGLFTSEQGGDRDLADTVSDYTMSVVGHVSAMYKAIIKAPRGASSQSQALSSQLLAEV